MKKKEENQRKDLIGRLTEPTKPGKVNALMFVHPFRSARKKLPKKMAYYDRYIERKLGEYVTVSSPPGWPVSSCAMATCRMITANRLLSDLLGEIRLPKDKCGPYRRVLEELWEIVKDRESDKKNPEEIAEEYMNEHPGKNLDINVVCLLVKLARKLRKC